MKIFVFVPKTEMDKKVKQADAIWDKAIDDFNAGKITEEAFDKIMNEVSAVQDAWLKDTLKK